MKQTIVLLIATIAVLCVGCHRPENDTPKPTAYLRFEFPEKVYVAHDTTALPFTFEKASNTIVSIKKDTPREKWINIEYPSVNGVVFLQYKHMKGPQELRALVDTSYQQMTLHFNYSSGIEEQLFVNPNEHVIATTYELKGTKVASTYQFWATDSTQHYLHGSLYLDWTPNNDSLEPTLDYLKLDLVHLLETLKWR